MALSLSAMAHGEEVLITVFFELVTIIILIVATFRTNLTLGGRLIFFVAWILETVLIWVSVGDVPYNQNRALITFLVTTGPLVAAGLVYSILRKRFRKQH